MAVDNAKLNRAYNLKNEADVRDLYREWADSYDRDMAEQLAYVAPRIVAETFCEFQTDEKAEILDVGCGTGLVGEELAARGRESVDGLDLSAEMIVQARQKDVYRNLFEGDLMKRLALPDDCYDAAISAGTFTEGHVGPDGLGEVIRVVRPGGLICITINSRVYDSHGYPQAFARLRSDGICRIIENRQTPYLENENIGARVAVLRVV